MSQAFNSHLLLKFINIDTRILPIEFILAYTQPTITCSELTIETVEQGVKYVQS